MLPSHCYPAGHFLGLHCANRGRKDIPSAALDIMSRGFTVLYQFNGHVQRRISSFMITAFLRQVFGLLL